MSPHLSGTVRALTIVLLGILFLPAGGLAASAPVPSPEELVNRAIALHNQEKCSEAIPLLIKALERAPKYATAWAWLGACYARLGRDREALSAFRQALRYARPGSPDAKTAEQWIARLEVRLGVGGTIPTPKPPTPRPPEPGGTPPTTLRLDFLSFSASLPSPVDRIAVRQAVAYGLDRQAIARLMPTAVPAFGIQHPKLPGYDPRVRGYSYDPAKARTLLARASWGATDTLRIHISTSRGYVGPAWDAVRAKILEDLRAVGISVWTEPVPFNTLIQLINSSQGASYIVGWASAPVDFGYPYFSVGIAHDWKFREGADALVAQFLQAGDAAQKLRIARELEQLLLVRAFIIPLFFRG